ncbi:MAG: translation initiation factor IF-2 [Salinivirgaceae bacterium]|nr:translation initiation factor IF-2 [Salinivirgaceae bacterium]
MSETNNSIRLNKAATQLGVGINTLIDFLTKKKLVADANPNIKIDDETYNILQKEFSSDQKVREQSTKVDLSHTKKESISAEKEIEEPAPIPETKQETRVEAKPTVEKTKVEQLKGPKVLGSIDLNKGKKKPQPKPEPKVEDKKPMVVKPTPKPVVTKSAPVENSPKVEPKPIEHLETKVEQLEGVKVLGTIDLNQINTKTRPDKKTNKEKLEERQNREAQRQANKVQKQKPVAKEQIEQPDFIETQKVRLQGPNVVGRIDLPQDRKGTPSPDDTKKKKRKRISKDRININAPIQQDGGEREGGKRQGKKSSYNKGGNNFTRKEINEEDVSKQIKDTLARLTAPKGKNKGAVHRREKREDVKQRAQEEQERQDAEKMILKVTEFVSVNELATMMKVAVTEVISTCMNLGLFVAINQRLDAETMALVADEFGYKMEFVSADVLEAIAEEADSEEDLQPRSPIVTVMGHVDHGKTSLLDYIRKANVIAGEAGGITQHIGAYSVKLPDGQKITFLDTPGHEAFSAMRARGAQITDIVIVVVAADDDIMPQTKEAISHAQAAGVPIVFAINKIDKPGANPEKIKEGLANMNLLVEDWGGKYQSQDISAKKGINVEELLEKVLLEAEMLNLRANPNKKAIGTVIESTLDKGRGYLTTVLVQNGTLKVGDAILAGNYTGRVKAMFNERSGKINTAGPATPVQILGLDGAPQAGDKFNVMDSEKEARNVANRRLQLQREQSLRTQTHMTLAEIGRRKAMGSFHELNIMVKADVDGSSEALSDSLIKLSTPEVQVNVIYKAVGQISESDVNLASASDAIIVGFNVRPSADARKAAEKEGVDIHMYSVIYDAIDEVKSAMEGMLSPEVKEEITGSVEVRDTFKISGVGTIAGGFVTDGKIKRTSKVRVIRNGVVVYTGALGSLKRYKDDAKDVTAGLECGFSIERYNDIQVGDVVEAFDEFEVKRKLE